MRVAQGFRGRAERIKARSRKGTVKGVGYVKATPEFTRQVP